MKSALLDRRIAGIIRWLERLQKSYTSGSIQSALMDAECARADLENLRQDMWAKVQPEEISTRKFLGGFMSVIRPSILAVIIILLAVVPLAKDIPSALPEPLAAHENNIVLAQPVIIEEYIQEQQEQPQTTTTKTPATAPKKKIAMSKRAQTAPASKPQTEKSVAYDKVFSLMQTGQRALKNNSSTIKIQ